MEDDLIPARELERLAAIAARFHESSGQRPRASVSGLWGSSAALIVAAFTRLLKGTIIAVVAPDEQEAAFFREDLEQFLKTGVPLYPALDPRTTEEREARLTHSERLALLRRIRSSRPPPAFVTPASALLAPIPSAEDLERSFMEIEVGMKLSPSALRELLERAGMEQAPLAAAPGEYSARGDIVDIFAMGASRPLRVEFLDDEVEGLRRFDPETQRSVAVRQRAVVPVRSTAGAERTTPFSEAISDGVPVFVLEPETTLARLKVYARELGIGPALSAAAEQLIRARPGCDLHRLPQDAGEAGAADSGESAHRDTGVRYTVLSVRSTAAAAGAGAAGAAGETPRPAGLRQPDLGAAIEAFARRCGRVRILCQVEAEADRLRSVLREKGIREGSGMRIELGRVLEGFQFPELGLCVVNHHELFHRLPVRRQRRKPAKQSRVLASFQELKPGDLVVHLVHGIARYEGLTRMERESGGEEDFMALVFRDDVALYVPVSKIHLVHRYVGSGDAAPPLDRIGGADWSRRKEKVKGALKDLAGELLETQAIRAEEKGFAFAPDDDLQRLFDASFPYEETEDQMEAMARIKSDMEARRPMDRLLCGDVGFGKTELAVRAAFKAAASGKQAAVLVPTTILAQQHYETFRSRLADYPVSVEVLSRFQNRMRQSEIVEQAREGRLDILIGTHRLLSRDVGFKDLGLLIIDEEQRFGVRHKERLKRLKRTVDVLTMTATPIPRTLHMALVGIRDISSLESPPEGRMAVQTSVEVRREELIRRAILLEVSRGGQVFFLHNRVETIDAATDLLRELVPNVRFTSAHGQMPERSLQAAVERFIRRDADVLVCTTIIESGIDMPQVNTIIIDRADMFGLADLHQLRGRVGRGSVKAYCYLLVPHKHVSSIAVRRLKAVEELSYLGAGFNIALKDLEIRGAGNVLGTQQHGHIAAVGYDLYCRLLKATVLQMKAEEKGAARTGPQPPGAPEAAGADPDGVDPDGVDPDRVDPDRVDPDRVDPDGVDPDDVDIDLDIQARAFVPPSYIPDEAVRIEILRRLAECRSEEGFAALSEELRDRFGRLPPETIRLIDVFRIRRMMITAGIQRLTRARRSREVYVELFDPGRYARLQPFRGARLNTVSATQAVLVLPDRRTAPDDVLAFLKSLLMPRAAG